MHHYKHHIGDYRRDTGHLSLLEHGVYRQLLDMYYLSEEPIPTETESVFRRLCARTEDERKAVISVLNEFFIPSERGYEHTRCEAEIDGYRAKAESARNNGKLGGRRKKAEEKPKENQSGSETKPKTKLTTNHKPLTNNKGATFSSWLKELEARSEIPIPEDDPIFDYAESAGIPADFLSLAWAEFKARYSASDKKYKDWRATFRNAVRANWFKLWWHDGQGYVLTTVGQQAMAAMLGAERKAA